MGRNEGILAKVLNENRKILPVCTLYSSWLFFISKLFISSFPSILNMLEFRLNFTSHSTNTFHTTYFPIIKFGLIEVYSVPNSHLSFNLHYQTTIFYPRHYTDIKIGK